MKQEARSKEREVKRKTVFFLLPAPCFSLLLFTEDASVR
jgi:hypothetical protein